MVQVINLGPSKSALQADVLQGTLGKALEEGLGKFTTNMFINKKMTEMENDKDLMAKPLSDRLLAAQKALAPWGEEGKQYYQQRMQIEQQKQQEDAFNKIRGLNLAGKKPQEIVASMYEALQNHPRAGEIISASLPYLLNKAASTQTAENIDVADLPGQPSSKTAPPSLAPNTPPSSMPYSESVQQPASSTPEAKTPIPKGKMTAQDITNTSNELLRDIRPDLLNESAYGNIPSFNFESKSDLRPSEEAQIRQKLKDVLPEVQETIINRVRDDIKTRYAEAKDRYGYNEDQRRAIQDKWDKFRSLAEGNSENGGLLTPFISQFTQDDDNKTPLLNTQNDLRDKYFQYAGDLPVNLTPEQMHARAMGLLQNDINSIHALKSFPSAPPFRGLSDMQSYLDSYSKAVKPLIDKGLIGSVKDDAYFNKDLGVEETHHAIWGKQTSKPLINSIANIPFPRKIEKHRDFLDSKEVNRYTNEVAKKLSQMSPEDDLILLRSAVMQHDQRDGLGIFTKALDQARENGLELSPFQMNQLQEVRLPREPPMWEFFTTEGYKKAFNMFRGKK